MTRTSTHLTLTLVALLVVTALFVPAGATAVAEDDPETADDYFQILQEIEDLAVYDEYGELDTVHTQSLTTVQVGEFTETDARELDAAIEIIRLFEDAQQHVENEEYTDAFEEATEIEAEIETLESYDEGLAALSRVALNRYYEQLASRLADAAEATDHTPTEIEFREMAATAHQGANNPDQTAEFTRQVEELDAELSADRDLMDDAEEAHEEFVTECSDCESLIGAVSENGFNVLQQYRTSLELAPMTADATDRAGGHGLEDREATLSEQADTTATMRSSLALASVVLVVTYGIILGAITALVSSRVFTWKRTYEAAQISSVVVMEDSDAP